MKREGLAAVFAGILLLGAGLLPLFGRWIDRPAAGTIALTGRLPENGGWSETHLTGKVGEPVRLRLASEDVVHGFAVAGVDQPAIDILPGEVVETELVFDHPGTYTFYCTRWCGANHWRMRGTIEISGVAGSQAPAPSGPPLYVELGIDLDAPHEAVDVPGLRPSAARGQALAIQVPAEYTGEDYLRSHSPLDLYQALRGEPLGQELSAQQLWDLTAFTWLSAIDRERLAEGQALYAQNCAACHGPTGAGDGVMAGQLAAAPELNGEMGAMSGHNTESPTDFSDLAHRLGRSPAALQGKIVRGGMGTGMPSWGSIFSEEQTWALVDALWTMTLE